MVLFYVLLWSVLDLVATRFQAAAGVSLWYPPPALDLALLLVFGLRYAPALLLTTALHGVLDPVGLGVRHVALLAVATTGAYTAAGWVLLRWVRIDPRLPHQRDVLWLVAVACGGAALLVAAVRVTLLCDVGAVDWTQLPLSVAGNWAGAATGIAMLTPVLLLAARRWPGERTAGWPVSWTTRPPVPADPTGLQPGRGEQAAQLTALLAAVYLAYARGPGTSLDYTYLVYVPLVWIAVRGGLRHAAPAVLLANVGAVALNGGRVPGGGGIALQFGLVTFTVTGLLLGALMTQRRADSEKHRHDALHDALTGLPNRVLFDDRLSQAAARTQRDLTRRVGVLFCDLDNFKQINDGLGHAAGDALLVEVGRRLRTVLRPEDTLARLSGDEFAVLLENLSGPAELEHIATRALTALANPHQLPGANGIVVNTSVGSALTQPGEPPTLDLLRDADVALHRAKRDGRRRHVPFDHDMHEHAAAGVRLESALRQALQDDQIRVALQPVVDLRSGQTVAVEALARWTHGPAGVVAPEQFIALAEQSGLIAALGESVLRQACAQTSRRAAAGQGPFRLAVNVSAHELSLPGYRDLVLTVLSDTQFPPDCLDLEITETQRLAYSSGARQALQEFSSAGLGLVVDDFGTGYSSFTYLHELPVTGLKIDRTFIAGLPHDDKHATIVRSILAMSAELGLTVTAEGVETHEQLRFLSDHGCSRAQGFLLGEPLVHAAN